MERQTVDDPLPQIRASKGRLCALFGAKLHSLSDCFPRFRATRMSVQRPKSRLLQRQTFFRRILFTKKHTHTHVSEEISNFIQKVNCRAIFTVSNLLEKVQQVAEALDIPVFVLGKVAGQFGVDLEEIFENASSAEGVENFQVDGLTMDDVLMAPLSSGTTSGTPKCVLLTHRNVDAATRFLKT